MREFGYFLCWEYEASRGIDAVYLSVAGVGSRESINSCVQFETRFVDTTMRCRVSCVELLTQDARG